MRDYRTCVYTVVFTPDADADWQYFWRYDNLRFVRTQGERYIATYVDEVPHYYNMSFAEEDLLRAFMGRYTIRHCRRPVIQSTMDFESFDKLAVLVFNYLSDGHIQFYSEKLAELAQLGFADVRYMGAYLKSFPAQFPALLVKNGENVTVADLDGDYSRENILHTVRKMIDVVLPGEEQQGSVDTSARDEL